MASVPNSGSASPPPPPVWDARPPVTALRYAGFWMRAVAALVDAIALAIIWQIIELFLPSPPPPPDHPDYRALLEYLNTLLPPDKLVAYALLIWAYFVFQETSSAQATVGKRLLGIRVSTIDGARLSLAAATVRTWPMYLPSVASAIGFGLNWLVTLMSLVACVAVAFSGRKQGLHDKMAGAGLTR